jgi:hypothetical protein
VTPASCDYFAVSEKCIEASKEFTSDCGATLLCARRVVDGWWQEVSRGDTIVRGITPLASEALSEHSEITSRS